MSIPADEVKIPALSLQRAQGQGRGTQRQGWGSRIGQISFDPEFTPGARNAVNVCLRVQADEKVCVITDEVTLEIAAAIVSEVEKLGAPYRAWVLEDLAERPLKDLPREIVQDLETSQVSIFAVQAQREIGRAHV
jgi:hypothetical protein